MEAIGSMLTTYKRGRIYWVRGTVNGIKVRETTSCTDQKAAELVRRRRERELADPLHHASNTATVETAAERFLRELDKAAKSKATIRFYKVKVRHVARLLGRVRLAALSHDVVLEYTEKREGEGAARYTVHRELTALRRILKSAGRANEFGGDWKKIIPEYAAGYVPRTRWLTPDDLWKVIRELPPHRGAVLAFIVATAADVSSARAAMREDVRETFVRVRGTKTVARFRDAPRVAVLAPFLEFAIAHADGENGRLFSNWTSLLRGIRRACVRCGIDYFTPRDLRRTVSTWFVRAGVSFSVAAKFLGHSSTAMLQKVYGQLDMGDVGALIDERTSVLGMYPRPADAVDASDGSGTSGHGNH